MGEKFRPRYLEWFEQQEVVLTGKPSKVEIVDGTNLVYLEG
jgi:hypothetical protein